MSEQTLPQEKTCTKCGETKPLGDFHRHRGSRDGHETSCRECRRRWYQLNREAQLERVAKWKRANPERVEASIRRRHKRRPPSRPCAACQQCGATCATPKSKYCSTRCQQAFQTERRIEQWLRGEIPGGNAYGVARWARVWLIEQRGEKCEQCGWSEVHPVTGKVPIEIDHIGSNEDHSPGNLRLLCPNCHSLTPNFRGLNRGNGRSFRRGFRTMPDPLV